MKIISASIIAAVAAITMAPAGGQTPAKPGVPPALLEQMIDRPAGSIDVAMTPYAIPAAAPGSKLDDLPGHRHKGHMYVYVLDGEVLSSLDGAPGKLYRAGDVWSENPGQLHRILNPRPGTIAHLLVFSVDPAATP